MLFKITNCKKDVIAYFAEINMLAKCSICIDIFIFINVIFISFLIFTAMLICIVCCRVWVNILIEISVIDWLQQRKFMRFIWMSFLQLRFLLNKLRSEWLLWRLLQRCLLIEIRVRRTWLNLMWIVVTVLIVWLRWITAI